jgi:DNA-binding transcriptional ArsR family regulator
MANPTAALAALADPTRREIFERVAERPSAVRELADGLPVSRPAVSQHLKVLKQAGLVADSAVGNRRVYRLDPRGLAPLRTYLELFWNRALLSFQAAAERPAASGGESAHAARSRQPRQEKR